MKTFLAILLKYWFNLLGGLMFLLSFTRIRWARDNKFLRIVGLVLALWPILKMLLSWVLSKFQNVSGNGLPPAGPPSPGYTPTPYNLPTPIITAAPLLGHNPIAFVVQNAMQSTRPRV